MLSILDPSNSSSVGTTPHNSIAPLASSFRNLVKDNQLNDLDAEWRELRNTKIVTESTSSCEFWVKVHDLKRGDGMPKFFLLSKFALNLLSSPHSSANAERIFSQVNLNKTKSRNRMDTATLEGLLHTKQLIGDKRCFDFHITQDLLKKHNDSMYER